MGNIYLTDEQKIAVFEPMFKKFETKEILEYFKEVITKIINLQAVLVNITTNNRPEIMDSLFIFICFLIF